MNVSLQCNKKISIIRNDLNSLLKYLNNIYTCSGKNNTSKNRYIVILYGPPASGKSLARKVACHIINKYFNEHTSDEKLYETFIDTSVDELTYNVQINNESVSDILKKIILNFLKNNNINPTDKNILSFLNKNIDAIQAESFKIYKENRMDALSELLFYFSTFLNKNIFFEIATANIKYLKSIVRSLKNYNYIPIVIYPFIDDVNIIYKRSLLRGLEEGRFLKCNGDYGLYNIIQTNITNYNKYIIGDFMKNPKFIVYRYNANLSFEDYKEINRFIFSTLHKYQLSLSVENDDYNIIDNKPIVVDVGQCKLNFEG